MCDRGVGIEEIGAVTVVGDGGENGGAQEGAGACR